MSECIGWWVRDTARVSYRINVYGSRVEMLPDRLAKFIKIHREQEKETNNAVIEMPKKKS
jgi:hypothetical protein